MNKQIFVKFKIDNVLDIDSKEISKEFGYRIGREVKIDIANIKKGTILLAYYNNNKFFATTPIKDIQEDEYGFMVTTKNRIYDFKYI